MPSAHPLSNGTPHDNEPNTTCADGNPSTGLTGAHININPTHSNVHAITDAHRGIEIDKACGFICSLGPLCNEKIKIVTDTGAISTLISAQTVNESNYLSELIKEPIRERVYYAGNDGSIISKYMIRMSLTTPEGIQLSIPVFVAEGLSESILLLGCDVLKELNAVIDVAQNFLFISEPQNCVEVAETCQLNPKEATMVIVALSPIGVAPLTRHPMPFHPVDKWSECIANSHLHFVKNLAYISCVNNSEDTLTIEQGTMVGSVGFDSTFFVCTLADLELPERVDLFSGSHLSLSQQKALIANSKPKKVQTSQKGLHVLHIEQESYSHRDSSNEHSDELKAANSIKYPWLPQDDV